MINFIWDLDGTLLDSYDAIVAGLEELYASYQLPFHREKVRQFVLQYSVKELLAQLVAQYGLDGISLEQERAQHLAEKNTSISLMEGAQEVLAWGEARGIRQFVFTHKGEMLCSY